MNRESVIVLIALATGLLAAPAMAQVDRQPTTYVTSPPSLQSTEGRVQQLEQEVKRLQAALESLRLTVNANQQQYAKHYHDIPYFGVTSAKTIYPGTPVSPGTLVAIQVPGGVKTTGTGPPK